MASFFNRPEPEEQPPTPPPGSLINFKPLQPGDSPAVTAGRSLNYARDLVRRTVSESSSATDRLNRQLETTDQDDWDAQIKLSKYEEAAKEAKAVATHACLKLEWESKRFYYAPRRADRPPVTPWKDDPRGWGKCFRQNKPKQP